MPIYWAQCSLLDDLKHPLDFSEAGTSNVKAIVMLANLNGNLIDIDMDSNNHYLDMEKLGGASDAADDDFERQRIEDLCESFKAKKDMHFYMLMIPPSTDESGQKRFSELWPTLAKCGRSSENVKRLETISFARGKDAIIGELERIAADLDTKSSYARLVE